MKPLNLFFEAFGWCALECISCAQGRREGQPTRRAFPPNALERILLRLDAQASIASVDLFNTGEPLLHRDLPELVYIARRYCRRVVVSTSGNDYACDLQALADAQPELIVSVSGATQEVYETTHKGGSIVRVKAFIEQMVNLGARNVVLCYHRYNNNLNEEKVMRAFARLMGVRFVPTWALHLHIEAIQRGDSNPYLVVPLVEQLVLARSQRDYKCYMLQNSLAITAEGDVRGCSGSVDDATFGNVFTDPLPVILERKLANPMCEMCYQTGAYKLYSAQNIIIDAECARRTPAPLTTKAKWAIERLRKYAWTWRELKRLA